MFTKTFAILLIACLFASLTVLAVAVTDTDCDGPFCASASGRRSGSTARSYASVNGGYSGIRGSYSLYAYVGGMSDSKGDGVRGYISESVYVRKPFTTESGGAYGSVSGTDRRGTYYSAIASVSY